MKLRWLLLSAALVCGLGLAHSLAAETYKVDTVHSALIFRVEHMSVGHYYGRFNNITGTFAVDDQNPSQSSFDMTVRTDSVDTASPKRDTHLKSPDFFNARQFPTMTFKSKQVSKSADGGYQVGGDLTLHGVTRPVTVTIERIATANDPRMGKRAGFEAIFTIKRSEFGMTNFIPMVGDEVKVIASLEGGTR